MHNLFAIFEAGDVRDSSKVTVIVSLGSRRGTLEYLPWSETAKECSGLGIESQPYDSV